MEILVASLVFLTGACLGVLVGLFTLVQRAFDKCHSARSDLSGAFREALDALAEIAGRCRRHVPAAHAGDPHSTPHDREPMHDEPARTGLASSHRGERTEPAPDRDVPRGATNTAGRAAGEPAGHGGPCP